MRASAPRRAGVAAWLAGAVVAIALAGWPAVAAEVDAATFAGLAADAAAGDPEALARLLDVDAVDGTRIDAGALVGPDDAGRTGRLLTLADRSGGSPPDADAARATAAEILAGRPFSGEGVVGGQRSVWNAVIDFVDGIARRLFLGAAGDSSLLLLTALAVVVVTLLVGYRLARRRAGTRRARSEAEAAPATAKQPTDLEDAAAAAEDAGDFAGAMRLRFRAGLLRLDRRGLVPLDPTMTTGRLARSFPAPGIDEVTSLFDEVVYGGRPATAGDAAATRFGWAKVLERRPVSKDPA